MSEYRGWFVQWIEQWSQLASGYNWRTFHLLMVEVEDDRHLGGVEATIVVLGLGVRVRWNYRVTEVVQELKDRIAEVEDKDVTP